MLCPGLYSVFAAVDVLLAPAGDAPGATTVTVTDVDERFRLVQMTLTGIWPARAARSSGPRPSSSRTSESLGHRVAPTSSSERARS